MSAAAASESPLAVEEDGQKAYPIDSPGEILEELEALPDIRPLPLEPYEEGLEFLPAADERESAEQFPGRGIQLSSTEGDEPGHGDGPDLRRLEELSEVEELSDAEGLSEAEDTADAEELSAFDETQLEETSIEHFSGAQPESALEDLGELEALDEAAGAQKVQELTREDRETELTKLLASGVVKSWTIGEMLRVVEESRSAIVMEDGVFRIKEEVYEAGAPGEEKPRESTRGGGLREIAQEVVAHASQPASGPEDSFSGIGDLIGGAAVFDIPGGVPRSENESKEDALPGGQEKTSPIKLTRNGIDYDTFLSFYPRSVTQTAQMKSLVEVSRRVSAVSAALLVRKASGHSVELTVGFNEMSRQRLHFNLDDPYYEQFFTSRKAVVIDRNPSEIALWKALVDQEDLRYIKRILLLPATFHAQDSYLLLAFAADQDLILKAIFSRLLVR